MTAIRTAELPRVTSHASGALTADRYVDCEDQLGSSGIWALVSRCACATEVTSARPLNLRLTAGASAAGTSSNNVAASCVVDVAGPASSSLAARRTVDQD